MESDRIFVIVVAYNGMRWYDKCLCSLLDSEIPVNVIVVDNASTDGTSDYIRQQYPEVFVIESDTNLGFGKANNLALKYALQEGFDYVFLLNQDAWIQKNTIHDLVRIQKKHCEYGIISPMHVRKDGRSLYMQIIDGNVNNPNKEIISDLYCGEVKDIYKEIYVNAAAWLINRATIEVLGGFDPIFNHYEEDVDYLNRAAYHGVCVGICPSVTIIHDHIEANYCKQNQEQRRRRHEQALTVELINPSNTKSLLFYVMKFGRKSLVYLFRGQFNDVKEILHDIAFICRNGSRLCLSRNTNKRSQPSWLKGNAN